MRLAGGAHTDGVEIAAVPGTSAEPPVHGERASAIESSSFPASLLSQQQLAVARDVLGALPPPIVYTLRDQPSSTPVEAVDRLFEVLQDGSFEPPAEELANTTGIIGATARAAQLFESPSQMWDAMRTIVGSGGPLGDAVKFARAEHQGAPPPNVASAEQAYAILGGALPLAQLGWWEAALLFLLSPRFA